MSHSPLSEPFIYSIIGLVFGIYIFIKSFGWRGRKNLIENTPTSKIRSLAMGLVEVYGEVVPAKGSMLKSPFTSSDCVYYMYKVEELRRSKRSSHWVTINQGFEGKNFFLKDDTGIVLVDPKGAEVEIPPDTTIQSGWGKDPPKQVLDFLNTKGISHEGFLGIGNKTMRFIEYYIEAGDKLCIMGTAGDNPFVEGSAEHTANIMIQKGQNEKIFYISDKPEKEILKSLGWKVWIGTFGGAALIVVFLVLIMRMLNAL